jgi:hypothetical protein
MKHLQRWLTILLFVGGGVAQAGTSTDGDVSGGEDALRPVHNTVTFHFGHGSMRDTYLTPLLYEGASTSLRYDRARRLRTPLLSGLQTFDGTLLTGEDKGNHSESWAARFSYRYALHFGLLRSQRYALSVGPYAGLEAGFDYNLKLASSNNPATVHSDLTYLGASLAAMVPYRLARRECRVHLLVQTPLLGTTLMPDYGASYYESFYLDEYGGSDPVVFTSLHNEQNLDLRLTTELPFALLPCFRDRTTCLTLGVNYRLATMKVRHTVRRFSALEAVVGWSYQQIPYRHTQEARSGRTVLMPW